MGGAEIRIKVPDEVARDIVFHYQLRFAAKEFRHEIEYKGSKLDRFVFQSMLVDEVGDQFTLTLNRFLLIVL